MRDNLTSILERGKALRSRYRNRKECIFHANREGQGGVYTVYHFVDSDNLRVETSSKKRRQQRKGVLKSRCEIPVHTFIGVSRKFHAEPVFCCCFFGDTKE